MGCLEDPDVMAMFERSNLPREQWQMRSEHLDKAEETEGLRASSLREISLVDMYLKPDGSSMGSEEHLLGVMPGIGLVLLREKGGFVRARRIDVQSMLFSDVPGLAFYPDDRAHGRTWGEYAAQGVLRGGQPVVRIGWPYDQKARSPQKEPSVALRERERILSVLPQ